MVTAEPSYIYIAQEKGRGWYFSSVQGKGFEKIIGSSVITNVAELNEIWKRKTSEGERVYLPIIDQTDYPRVAIFIMKGN